MSGHYRVPLVIFAQESQYFEQLDLQPGSWYTVVVKVHGELPPYHLFQDGHKASRQVLVNVGALL